MSRGGHVPIRTCMGCGARAAQDALLRIALDAERGLRPDPARRAGGRGGYLHRQAECWAQFARRKGQVRSLRATVDRPVRAALVNALIAAAGE